MRASNKLASREAGEPAHGGRGYSVWHTFRSPQKKNYTLRTFQSNLGTRIALYRGPSVSQLTSVARSAKSAKGAEASLSFTASAGVTYRVAVDAAREGDFVLCGRAA